MDVLSKKRIALLLICFLLFISAITTVYGCFPAGPNPWYAIATRFDSTTFPPGVKITSIVPNYPSLALSNDSSTPLYVVEKNDYYEYHVPEIPEGFKPDYKLISNQVYYWSYSDSPNDGSWVLNGGGINNTAGSKLEIHEGIYTIQEASQQIYQDDRPNTVSIPEPQSIHIMTIYKGKPWEIKGTLYYSLNTSYDPQARQKGVEACNKWSTTLPVFSILFSIIPIGIVLTIVGGGIYLLYKVIRFILRKIGKK